METKKLNNILPTEDGFFGKFGGQFLPDELKQEFDKITKTFLELKDDEEFNNELDYLLKHYADVQALFIMQNLSEKYGSEIYFKREDLNHTGAHKINHSLGEALLAKKNGQKEDYCRDRRRAAWGCNCNCCGNYGA